MKKRWFKIIGITALVIVLGASIFAAVFHKQIENKYWNMLCGRHHTLGEKPDPKCSYETGQGGVGMM